MMQKIKPVISNQHGALVMSFIPFIYGIFLTTISWIHLAIALSWIFLYLFSYPFLLLFSQKTTSRNRNWAIIYFILSLIPSLVALCALPSLVRFLVPIAVLSLVQIFYAWRRDERHWLNTVASYLLFGTIGMAVAFVENAHYYYQVLIDPTLFFIATTFYVKSIGRERKNPRYLIYRVLAPLLLMFIYAALALYFIAASYLFALARAIIIPQTKAKLKQVGMFEFLTITIFILALMGQSWL